jgi:hypothetical protein
MFQANDFFFADGFTGDVPALYTHAQRKFHNRVVKAGRLKDVRLCEWARDDWTFHGKGLWWEADVSAADSIAVTFIGSSNYGNIIHLIHIGLFVCTHNFSGCEERTVESTVTPEF